MTPGEARRYARFLHQEHCYGIEIVESWPDQHLSIRFLTPAGSKRRITNSVEFLLAKTELVPNWRARARGFRP